jgi:hypothetical protein
MNATSLARSARQTAQAPIFFVQRAMDLARGGRPHMLAVLAASVVGAAAPLAMGVASADAAPRLGQTFGGQASVTSVCAGDTPTQAIVALQAGDIVQGTLEVVSGPAAPSGSVYSAVVTYADWWPNAFSYPYTTVTIDGSKVPFSFTVPTKPPKGMLNSCVKVPGMVALVTYTVYRSNLKSPMVGEPIQVKIAGGIDGAGPAAADTNAHRLLVNAWYGMFRDA